MPNIRVGKKDVNTQKLGHVKGIKQGNSVGNYEKQSGHLPNGRRTAESSTGVNPEARNPIDPRMPNLPPG